MRMQTKSYSNLFGSRHVRKNLRKRHTFLSLLLLLILFLVGANVLLPQNDVFNQLDILKEKEIFKARVMRDKYNVNCKLLFEDDEAERNKSIQLMQELKGNSSVIRQLNDSNYIFDSSKCDLFRDIRGYDKHKVTDFETNFPLAYTILVNENVEQFERLLRVIYRPQNIYCIHVDRKSSADLKSAVESISSCFDNVFITTKTESVFWGHFSLLKAQLNCMSDLLNLDTLINVEKHPRLENKRVMKWKYWLNSPSTFLPIRTNFEIAKILSMYNGTSDVEIFKINPNPDRVNKAVQLYIGNTDLSKKDSDNGKIPVILHPEILVYLTGQNKSSPPYNFSILKGWNYIAASHMFVDYIINSEYGMNLSKWAEDSYVPDEMLYSTLLYNSNHNKSLGFIDSKDTYVPSSTRFLRWSDGPSWNQCYSYFRHWICVMSIYDLPLLRRRPEFWADKFDLSYDPVAFQCMEEWNKERVELGDDQFVDLNHYCTQIKAHSSLAKCSKRPKNVY